MHIERRYQPGIEKMSRVAVGLPSPVLARRRVRIGRSLLHREADRGRRRANLMMLASHAALLALVGILHEVLQR
jgi:hypothetical protein